MHGETINYNDHINNQQYAAFYALFLMVMLYMFRPSLAHHQEFRKLCVKPGVVFQLFFDSVFCLPRALSVQGFVGPGLVCVVCPLGGVRCELWRHSQLFPELLMMSE